MSDWNSGAPAPPESIEQWLNVISRQINDLTVSPKGFGREAWTDTEMPPGFVEEPPFLPGWRWTQDGRIELRGRVRKRLGGSIANGEVVLLLPYECAPPHNKQGQRSSVSIIGFTTVGLGNPGVCRFDIQLEAAWLEEPKLDGYGNPMFDESGNQIMTPISKTEVIARPPQGIPITGWIGFDHLVYDARLYLDVLAPVPAGEDPLVPHPGIALIQNPDGSVQEIVPGVEYQ